MAGDGCGGLWGCGGLRGAGGLVSALYCEHHDVQHKTRKSVNEQAFYMHDVGYRAEQRGLFHIFLVKICFCQFVVHNPCPRIQPKMCLTNINKIVFLEPTLSHKIEPKS